MVKHRQILKRLAAGIGGLISVLLPLIVLAQVQSPDANLASDLNLAAVTPDLRQIIINVLQYLLGFLGLVAVIIILYGGFVWMTAAGNADKIKRAKQILINATIGLVIILSAWIIVALIARTFTDALTGQPPGGGSCDNDGICEVGENSASCPGDCPIVPGGGTSFRVTGFAPPDGLLNPPGAPRNTVVKIFFSKDIDKTTATVTSVTVKKDGSPVAGTISYSGNRTVLFTPSAACPPPNATRFCFEADSQFTTEVDSDVVKSSVGQSLTGIDTATWWTNNKVDTSSPLLNILAPGGTVAGDSSVLFSARVRDDGVIAEACLAGEEEGNPGNLADITAPLCDSAIPPAEIQDHIITRSWDTTGQTGKYFSLKATGEDSDANALGQATKRVKVVAAHCGNNTKDADETDIDCGGADCGGCDGAACDSNLNTPACQADDTLCAIGRSCSASTCKCVSRPTITEVQLPNGAPGNYVTINGRGFGDAAGRVVFMGTDGIVGTADDRLASLPNPAGVCASADYWTPTEVIVEVPSGASTGPVYLEQSAGEGGLNDDTTNSTAGIIMSFTVNGTIRPSLACLTPTTGCFIPATPTSVNFYGKNFGAASAVEFGNKEGLNFAAVSPTQVKGDLPDVQPATLGSRVVVGAEKSNPVSFVATSCLPDPRIDKITPATGPVKQTVTISGANFGSAPGEVRFIKGSTDLKASTNFPAQCTTDSLWQDNQIIVRVPDGATATGDWEVKVKRLADAILSPAKTFTVTAGAPSPLLCRLSPSLGPVGTAVKFIGEGFGNTQGTGNAYFYNNVAASSLTGWSNTEVRGAAVPNTALSGPANIKNDAGQSSNPLNYVVGSCRANSDCQAGDICCGDGTCRLSGDCPAATAYALRSYRWRFTAGDPAPRVVERASCDEGNQMSPNPFKNQINVCPNTDSISLTFNTTLKNSTCSDGTVVKVEECNDSSCRIITGPPAPLAPAFAGSFCLGNEWSGQLPANWLKPGKWYRGTVVAAKVFSQPTPLSPSGVPMARDYSWQNNGWKWQVGTVGCEVKQVMCAPRDSTIMSLIAPNNTTPVDADLVAENCNSLTCTTINWSSSDPAVQAPIPGGSTACTVLALGTAETTVGPVSVTAQDPVSQKAGICKVNVRLADLKVEENFPACEAACRNAAIGVRFNISVDPGSVGANDVILEQCSEPTCTTAPVRLTPTITVDDSGTSNNFSDDQINIKASGLLLANTHYRVTLNASANGILSVDGKQIVNESDQATQKHVWIFRTTDKVCEVDRLTTLPDWQQVKAIGARGDYQTVPFSAPDSCSATGQRLEPDSLGYNWTSQNLAVATVSNNNNFDLESTRPLIDPRQTATAVGTDSQCSVTPFQCSADIQAATQRASDSQWVTDSGVFSLQCGFKKPGACRSAQSIGTDQALGWCSNDNDKTCTQATDCGTAANLECRKPDANCDGSISGLDFNILTAQQNTAVGSCPGLDPDYSGTVNWVDLDRLGLTFAQAFKSFPQNSCNNGLNKDNSKFSYAGSLEVSSGTKNIVVTPDSKYAILTHASLTKQIDFVDIAKRQVVKTLTLAASGGASSISLSADGRIAAVVQPGHVTFIDVPAQREVGVPVALTSVVDLALTENGQELFVTRSGGNSVSVIELADRSISPIAGLNNRAGIARAKVGGKELMWVADSATSQINVLDVSARGVVGTPIAVSISPATLIADETSSRLYVRSSTGQVAALNMSSKKLEPANSVGVGAGIFMASSRDGKYLAVNNTTSGRIDIFNAATLVNLATVQDQAAPLALAFVNSNDLLVAHANSSLTVISLVGSCLSDNDCTDAAAIGQCPQGSPTSCQAINGTFRCANDPNVPCADSQGNADARFCNFSTNTAGCCGARPWVESVKGALSSEDNSTCRNSAFVVRFNTVMNPSSIGSAISLVKEGACVTANKDSQPWYLRIWNFLAGLFGRSATAQAPATTCPVSARVIARNIVDLNGNPLQTEAVLYPNGLLSQGNYRLIVLGDPGDTAQKGVMSASGIRMGEDSITRFEGGLIPPPAQPDPSGYHPPVTDKICALENIQVAINPELAKAQQESTPRTLFNPYDTYSCFGDAAHKCNCEPIDGKLGCRVTITGQEVPEDQNLASNENDHRYVATALTREGQEISASYNWNDDDTLDPQRLLAVSGPDQAETDVTLINNLGVNRTGLANIKVTATSGWTCSNDPTKACVTNNNCGSGTCQGPQELTKSKTIPVSVYLCKFPWSNKFVDLYDAANNPAADNFLINYCRDNNNKSPLPDFRAALTLQPTNPEIRQDKLFREPDFCVHNSAIACTGVADCKSYKCPTAGDCTGDLTKDGYVDLADLKYYQEVKAEDINKNGIVYACGGAGKSCTKNADCSTGIQCLPENSDRDAITGAYSSMADGQCRAGLDAIRLQVQVNSRHLSPIDWYDSQSFAKASPQSTMVDGYAAIQDGRTIYIGAGNAVGTPGTGNLFTNIFILSYTQNARSTTQDVWQRMISGITFNINQLSGGQCLKADTAETYKVCSANTAQVCSSDTDCAGQGSCVALGCLFDNDCPKDYLCDGRKPQIARDVRRVTDIIDTTQILEQYHYGTSCARVTVGAPGDADCNGKIEGNDLLMTRYYAEYDADLSSAVCKGADFNLSGTVNNADVNLVATRVDESCKRAASLATNYPSLSAGSYVQGTSTSRWPSWQDSFGSEFRSQLPVDPINRFGNCDGFNKDTCWKEDANAYACQAQPAMCNLSAGGAAYPPAVPNGSHVYTYTGYGVCQKEVTTSCLFDSDCQVGSTDKGPCLRGTDYAACGFLEACFGPTPTVLGGATQGNRLCVVSAKRLIDGSAGLKLPPPAASSCSFGTTIVPTPPPLGSYTLTVTAANNTGAEKVTSDAAAINCPGDCNETLPAGTFVQLVANPQSGTRRIASFVGCDRVYSLAPNWICEYTVRDTHTISVNFSDPGPVISSFTANPATINLGQTTTLTWSIGNSPDTVRLKGNGVDVPNCTGNLANVTTCKVQPAGTTYYQLVAENNTSYDIKYLNVYVQSPPNTLNIPAAVDVWHPGAQTYLLAVPAPNACVGKTVKFSGTGFTSLKPGDAPGTATGTCQANGVMSALVSATSGSYFVEDYCVAAGDCRDGNTSDIN